jgi:hypothetical protein
MNIHNIGSLVYWDHVAGHFLSVTLLHLACLTEQPCEPTLSRVFTVVVMKCSVTLEVTLQHHMFLYSVWAISTYPTRSVVIESNVTYMKTVVQYVRRFQIADSIIDMKRTFITTMNCNKASALKSV